MLSEDVMMLHNSEHHKLCEAASEFIKKVSLEGTDMVWVEYTACRKK
jgi:hypothetical protein